jgi:hypothetical protein
MSAVHLLRPRVRTWADAVEARLRDRLGEQRMKGVEVTDDAEGIALVKCPWGLRWLYERRLEGWRWWITADGRIAVQRPRGDHGP